MTRPFVAAMAAFAAQAAAAQELASLGFREFMTAAAGHAPAVAAAAARLEAARSERDAAGLRPAPLVTYEQWGVPLAVPASLDRAQMLMFGVRQPLPPLGTADSARRVAESSVRLAGAAKEAVRLDFETEAARTWVLWWRADRLAALAHDALDRASEATGLARSRLAARQADAADLLRLSTDAAETSESALLADAEAESLRRIVNRWMDREDAAPLPMPESLRPASTPGERERPEVAMARLEAERAQHEVETVHIAAERPAWEFGVQYQYMPMQPDRHGYAAMVGLSLPSLDPARVSRVRAAEASVVAAEASKRAADRLARIDQSRVTIDLEAAWRALDLVHQQLVPMATRALEASLASFAGGRGSALALSEALRGRLRADRAAVEARARLLFAHLAFTRARGLPPALETDR